MGNCLVTKLKGSVQNDYLPKLGELIIDVDNAKGETIELSVSWGTINYRTAGDVSLQKKNDDRTYAVTGTGKLFLSGKGNMKIITWGTKVFSFPNLLCEFNKENVSLNISNEGNNTPISKCRSSMILKNTNIVGSFSEVPHMYTLICNNCTLNGDETLDLSALPSSVVAALIEFSFTSGKITGDISLLDSTHAPLLSNKAMNVWGNKDKIGTWGDVSKLLKEGNVVMLSKSDKGYTWSNRPSNYKILSISGCNFKTEGDIDKMFVNQATLEAGSSYQYKVINAIGTRTATSDSAIATLQEKGFTVSVTPES